VDLADERKFDAKCERNTLCTDENSRAADDFLHTRVCFCLFTETVIGAGMCIAAVCIRCVRVDASETIDWFSMTMHWLQILLKCPIALYHYFRVPLRS
jgi:hypothetical protein